MIQFAESAGETAPFVCLVAQQGLAGPKLRVTLGALVPVHGG